MVTEFFLVTLPGHRQVEQLACLEVLTEAQAVCGAVSIHQVALRSVTELWKAHVVVHARPSSVVVLLSGSEQSLHGMDYTLGSILRRAWRPDVTLCSVGAASKYLARLGMLNGMRVAALPDEVHQLSERFKLTRWDASVRALQDGNLVTSVGFFGATEASLLALRGSGNLVVAEKVAARLAIPPPSCSEVLGAIGLTLHPAVQRAADVLKRDPLRSWTTSSVAKVACVSERHLQRLFKAQFSCGVLDYLQKLRLETAMHYFRVEPHLTLEKVAQVSGFSSSQQLRRVLRKEHGHSPSAVRRRARDAANDSR